MGYAALRVTRLLLRIGILLGALVAAYGGDKVLRSKLRNADGLAVIALVGGVALVATCLLTDRPLALMHYRREAERRRSRLRGERGFEVLPPR